MFQQIYVEWCWKHASVSRGCPVTVPDTLSRGPSRRGVFPTYSCPFYCELIQLSHVCHWYTKTGQILTISYSSTFELSLSNLKTVWTLWILFIISLKQIEQKQTHVHSYMTWPPTDILRNCPCWWTQLSGWCMYNEFRYGRMPSCHSNMAICDHHLFPPGNSFEKYLMYTYKILGTTGSIKL